MEKLSFEALNLDKKQRLDKFLLSKLIEIKPEFSRSRLQNIINSDCVFLLKNEFDRQVINNCDYKIKGNERFLIEIPEALPSLISPKKIAFEVIFEDKNMLVINKPAGLTTHPGSGNDQDTLVNALLFYCGKTLSGINGVMRPGIVHRLDKETSGLMVVAKNDLAHQELARQIEQRILKRNYLAFCYGTPKPLSGSIDKNIGRSKINRLKMAITRDGGRKAITHYEVQKIYLNGLVSMVKCSLETGRTHQIRVHLNSVGHPIIGDLTYGSGKRSLEKIDNEIKNVINNFKRQALHSYKISFLHPISKKEMEFEIDFPKDINDLKITLDNLV